MADDYYDYEDDGGETGSSHLFLWTVFILLLIGGAFACWLGSFYVFGHPEKPTPYKILKKLNKIEPPKRFGITVGPTGDFLTPKRLFDRYASKKPLELQEENDTLLRNYIKNYKETKKLVPYATGHYEIIDTYKLAQTDFFPGGAVAVAVAVGEDVPPVIIQHVCTTGSEDSAKMRDRLTVGQEIVLEKTNDLAAVIHVDNTADGYLMLTVIPLTYGTYGWNADRKGQGQFSLQPPSDLNVAAGLPIVRGEALQESLTAYTTRRRGRPREIAEIEGEARRPAIVRVETQRPGAAVPETGALPEVPVATPIPAAGMTTPRPLLAANTTPAPRPAATPARPAATPPSYAANFTPTPRLFPPATPRSLDLATVATPIPIATPLPRVSPTGVPLKPFLTAMPPSSAAGTESWRTYSPGRQPSGRVVTATELSEMANRDDLRGQIYLRGKFIVAASGNGRAVLRTQDGAGSLGARVIVDYPSTLLPPPEKADFSRDSTRGYEVQKVERGPTGQLNIWAREITEP